MHELGIMIDVVKTVENFAKENGVSKIDTLVLQIGELSPVIPKYIEQCYEAAIYETSLESTKLKIEIMPGNGICKKCGKVFNILASSNKCPNYESHRYDVLCGREFFIKEIVAC